MKIAEDWNHRPEREEGPSGHPLRNVFSLRDFRLLFAGSSTSLLGDQLVIIATPWLVLQLTGDALALGIVLALESIPRALFMLFGGAVTDRFTPRRVMLAADLIRCILTAGMALAVITGTVRMWMLYAFGTVFGLVAGFAVPAGNSIVPTLVKQEDLQAGNSAIMGVEQLAGLVGPVLAGLLIARFAESLAGVGIAFGADSVTFALSAVALWMMRSGRKAIDTDKESRNALVRDILEGLRYVWSDGALRFVLLVIAGVNFLFVGPILVGIPVLANLHLASGAVGFGLLMSGFSGGHLVGFLVAAVLPRLSGRQFRRLVVGSLAAFGGCLVSFAWIRAVWILFSMMMALGLANGYLTIVLFTWIQTWTPMAMLGRTMSLLLLASAGLLPVSQALSGAVARWSLPLLFAGAGGLILAGTIWAATQPGLQDLSRKLTTEA